MDNLQTISVLALHKFREWTEMYRNAAFLRWNGEPIAASPAFDGVPIDELARLVEDYNATLESKGIDAMDKFIDARDPIFNHDGVFTSANNPGPVGVKTVQVPSVGRIVHVRIERQCMAALVLEVDDAGSPDSTLTLYVLSVSRATGGFYMEVHVPHGDGERQWHWPEFVPAVPVQQPMSQ